MKAHITSAGFLELERNGKSKPQICPMNSNRHMCGDYCPLFGEPVKLGPFEMVVGDNGKREMKSTSGLSAIILCHGKLYVELTDDRPRRKEVAE